MLRSPPVPEPVPLQPSIFLLPLFAPLHLVQFAAPAQPCQHGKRIAKRLCYACDSHTLDQQPTACNSETLSLSCWTWSKGRNKQNVMRLFETESVVKLVSRCTHSSCDRLPPMWKLHSSLMMQPNWVNCELAMTSLRKEHQQKCISLNWYDVICRRHLHSSPGYNRKAPAAEASESCSRCRSISCFCCSAKAAAEACCACTLLWKRQNSKAQPSNNSSILLHGHIHNLAEKLSWNTKEQSKPNSRAHLLSTLTLRDICQQPKTSSKYVSQPPELLKAFVATSAPDGICMQTAAKHASLEPPQKPPPTTWNFNGQTS